MHLATGILLGESLTECSIIELAETGAMNAKNSTRDRRTPRHGLRFLLPLKIACVVTVVFRRWVSPSPVRWTAL